MLYGVEVPQSVTRPLLSQKFLHHYTPSVVIPSLNHSSLLTFAPLCSSSTSISVCPLFLAKSKAVCPLCTAHKDELSKGCVRVAVRLVYTWISRTVFHLCPAYKDALSKGLAPRGCDALTCCAYSSKPISKCFEYKYIQIYMSCVRPHGLTGTLEQVYINTYMYTYYMLGLTGLRAHVIRRAALDLAPIPHTEKICVK